MTPLLLALLAAGPVGGADGDPAWLHVRGGLPRTGAALAAGGPVRVVFFGGSITERDGFRPLVEAGLRTRFPAIDWKFENRGVSSTGSITGLFRYHEGGVRTGEAPPPVLVILESAVNDDQDERLTYADAVWAKEGFVRGAAAPTAGHVPADAERWAVPDLLMVHFPNPAILEALRVDRTPVSVAAHEAVAGHYDLSSVSVAAEVARRVDAGTLTWEEYGGTHPGPVGNELAADLILNAVDRGLAEAPEVAAINRPRWERPKLCPEATDRAAIVSPFGAGFLGAIRTGREGWELNVPPWETIPGTLRPRFQGIQILHSTAPGATLTLDPAAFRFTAVGLYVLAGPDAGALEVTVPGEEPRTVPLYHDPHSKNLHYPRTVLLYRAAEPPPGPVTVTVVAGERGGTAVRVVGVGLGMISANRPGQSPESRDR